MPVLNYIKTLLLGVILIAPGARAQPSLQSTLVILGEKIYKDISNANKYYFMPLNYKLVRDASGKPSFTLTQMRYTGTRTAADAGVIKFNNLLQFKVATDDVQQRRIPSLKTALKAINPQADLQMLPVIKFSSVLVFASSTQGSATDTISSADSAGFRQIDMAGVTDEKSDVNNSYWTERTVSIRLSDFDAQLVEAALQNRQSVMSFSYAIFTAFYEKTQIDISAHSNNKVKRNILDHFKKQLKGLKDTTRHMTLIKADVVELSVDISRWPGLVQKVDINERLPARYALFDVYCYDFANSLRADLFEKKIEIRASSVGGMAVTESYTFKQTAPDIYARSIRFPYAVRLDLPFYYQVTEIDHNGEKMVTEWIEKKEWNDIVDITSAPEKFVRPAVEAGQ